ncbi:hypothetical protein [Undibacterium sp. TJN19]|uniref:hypothetical protein n=1 Tax=Undibacterium sp. TJN19 TaxID=3413055 RepID=UPI003BF160CD
MHKPARIAFSIKHSVCCLLMANAALMTANVDAAPETVACKLKVFPMDPDPKGSNIRNGPGSENKVLTVIKDSDSEIEVIGSAGKWLQVRQVTGVNGTVYFKGEGWMYAPLTGINAKAKTGLHASADKQSAIAGQIPADAGATVQSCSGEWLEIQYKNLKAWMPPHSYCGNPVTTCS